jgi:hypothetical protein
MTVVLRVTEKGVLLVIKTFFNFYKGSYTLTKFFGQIALKSDKDYTYLGYLEQRDKTMKKLYAASSA